jgi:complement component 1 Q subcomponent-binding protein
LDPRLQAALREYLVARGVNPKLATSILQHLLEKERSQYVNWLKALEQAFAKDR